MLAAGMLVFGSLNTISMTYANNEKAVGTESPSTVWGKLNKETDTKHAFDHPFVQAACMFVGEFLCFVAHLVTRKRKPAAAREVASSGQVGVQSASSSEGWNGAFFWAIPACCDIIGTGVMLAGLCLSYASVFQMLRGSSVVFTAGISAIFLKRKIYCYQWFSVFLVVLGVAVVGIVSMTGDTSGGKDSSGVAIGNVLIIFAQFVVACQMCIEEKIMAVYPAPALKAVGLEGVFGLCVLCSLLAPMYYIHIDGAPFESVPDAFSQIKHDPSIVAYLSGTVVSIAVFNFCGVSITKHMSASHRMVLDSVRTLVVWGYSLAVKWETFHGLQLLGFVFLSLGTAMYNEIIRVPAVFSYPIADEVAGGCSRSFVGDADHGSFLGKVEECTGERLLQQERHAGQQWQNEF